MTLSSWIAALALMGSDEPQNPRQPIIPGSPIPAMMRCEKSGDDCPWVGEIRASVRQTGNVDASMLAACAAAAQSAGVQKAGSMWDDVRAQLAKPRPTMPKVTKPRTTNDPEPRETWKLSLPEAIRIGLKNCEIVEMVSSGEKCASACGTEPTALKTAANARTDTPNAQIVIARRNTDAGTWRFKAEVMAMVRSVEQQYWNLAQAHVQLWCADRALKLCQEVLERERAKLTTGRGTIADIAEAEQRLAQFQLDVITRTSDLITTERQLRNLLGLAPGDGRRIVPTTAVTEARIEPDWDSCLAEMRSSQPDILQQKAVVRLAEIQLLMARNQLLPVLGMDSLYQFKDLGLPMDSTERVMLGTMLRALESWVANRDQAAAALQTVSGDKNRTSWEIGGTFQIPTVGRSSMVNTRQAQYILLRSRAYLQQVEHQTTHSLARFFLEIDANYKQFQAAERLRQAAAQRLDAQRAYYEEGRITIDRFLDAITQYATAVATESQYKTTYNISLAALEETKGTLLERKNIIVAELSHSHPASPQPAKAAKHDLAAAKPDSQVVTASMKAEQPKPAEPTRAAPATTAPASTKTWTFSFSIGRKKPLKIKGTITSTESAPASPAN